MSPARLHLLGQPAFERDGQPVEVTSAKAIALLAYLALRDAPQRRESLLTLLWAESAEEAARKNLRNTLWTIRRLLGEDVLAGGEDRLALLPSVWFDVREFEQAAVTDEAATALDLYRGPLLDGLTLHEAPEFEFWLAAERERLAQTYLRLVSGRIEAAQRAGDWPGVAAAARLALAQDNLQEPVHRALIDALARQGERADALRQYETLRAVLADELGVEPLPETEALRAAIANGTLPPAIPPAQARPRRDRSPRVDESAGPPFVGRQAELAALDAELQAVAAGQARAVLLTGELGIGKSRLWREWSAGLSPEVTVLECGCVEATNTLPFAPVAELFGSAAGSLGLLEHNSSFPPLWLAEVARLIPELRQARPDLPPPASLPPDEERLRVFEAFSQCLLPSASGPLVLFVDDLHWVDRATLDWLGYLIHRRRERPVMLVGAYRPDEASAALVQRTAGWARDGVLRRLPLAPLPHAEAVALIAGLVGDASLRRAITGRVQTQSAGNPYFMIELCRAGPGDMPSALAELVRARIDRLPDAARQVVQAAAVVEPDFDFALLRGVSGRDELETLDALDALLGGAVLVERGGAYAFAHPLVASVVRGGLSGARRAFLSRRAAEFIETTHAGRLPPVAGRLAAFYADGGEPERAAHYAEMAAAHAASLAAMTEAVELYRLAHKLSPSPARELGLGRALHHKGDLAEARQVLQSAMHGFTAHGDRDGVAQAQVTLADGWLRMGRFDEVLAWAENGLADIEAAADPAVRAYAHHLVGAALLHANRPLAEAEMHLSRASLLAQHYGLPDAASRSRFALGNALAQRGDLAGAIRTFREVIPLARAAGDTFHEILAHNNLAYNAMRVGDLAAAHEDIDAGLAQAQTQALDVVYQWLYSTRGEIALAEAEWGEAEAWFRRGLVEAERHKNPEMIASYHANLGLAARGRGDLDAAVELLDLARQAAPASHLQQRIDLWQAEIYLQRGERAAAIEALGRAEAGSPAEEAGPLKEWADRLRAQLAPSR